jgi:hypothetical protein
VSGSRPVHRAVAGWVAVLVSLAGIGLVLVASASGRSATVAPVTAASPAPEPSLVTSGPPQEPAATGPVRSTPPFVIDVLIGVVVAALLVLIAFVTWTQVRRDGDGLVRRRVRAARRPPPAPVAAEPAAGALAEAVDAGLRLLDEGDPPDAVIACWVWLERAAAAAGTPRRPSETPAQLVIRVLAEHAVTEEVLDRLATLYREARYSRHVLGEPARAEARATLERVRQELAGAAPAR